MIYKDMPASSFGRNFKITVFGGSHEDSIGVTIEGIPFDPDLIDMEKLQKFMDRRAPGSTPYGTPRKEADIPVLVSKDPITYIIKNTDTRSSDYAQHKEIPRPGHADYTAYLKYELATAKDLRAAFGRKTTDPKPNMAGGGPFSGRMTAPLCIAGGIALQLLEKQGVALTAQLISAGPYTGDQILPAILEAKDKGDSLGGQVAAQVTGLAAGVGGPMYQGIESYVAPIIFGIPGVKGLSFGEGFDSAVMTGSGHNDTFVIEDGQPVPRTNMAGGILGGISTGLHINLKVAFKPTSSIGQLQDSVDLDTMTDTKLVVKGRHDPCIALRAVPVVEAAVALGILDAILEV